MSDVAVMNAVLRDTRLSTDARAVVLYVFGLGPGPHEISFAVIRRLLNQAGEKRVRTAVQDAEDVGWLTVVRGGNAGQHPRFTFNSDPAETVGSVNADTAEIAGSASDPAETAASAPVADPAEGAASADAETAETAGSDAAHGPDPAEIAGSGAPHVCEQGDQKTTSASSASSPSARTGVSARRSIPDDGPNLLKLRDALGPFQAAVDQLSAAIPERSEAWAAAILTSYLADHPTETDVLADIPPPNRPQRVAQAMTHYALQHTTFNALAFRGFMRKGRDAGNDNSIGTGAPRRADSRRAAAAVAGAPDQASRRARSFGT